MSTEISMNAVTAVPRTGDGFRALVLPTTSASAARSADLAPESAVGLSQAVQDLRQQARSAGAELDFRIDEDSGRVVVSVIDQADGTVLRQMPSEEALRISRNLAKLESCVFECQA
ncbi:MAG: flagellar protein FlaG [Panacagrimonas sp.]